MTQKETSNQKEAIKVAKTTESTPKKTAASQAREFRAVRLRGQRLEQAVIRVEGRSRLVMHRFPEKARKQLRDKKSGIKTRDRSPTDPEAEYQAAMHTFADGSPGFPCKGFKASILKAAHKDLGIPRTFVSNALFIESDGDNQDGDEMVRIECQEGPKMREDHVRVASGAADLRYRPEFITWTADLRIEYDTDWLTLDTIVSLIDRAGFGIGVGEDRPGCGKGGGWGRYRVARTEV